MIFDLDYTLLRPSDQFEAPGYVRTGARFGLRAGRGALAAGGARRLRRGRGAPRADRPHPRRRPAAGDRPRHHRGSGRRPGRRRRADGRGPSSPPGPGPRTSASTTTCCRACDALRAAGVRMALLSNALGHGVEEIVAHFALDDYMAAAVSSLETGVVKPAPRMFSTLFALLGVSPARRGDGRRQRGGRREGRRRLRLPGDPAGPRRAPPGARRSRASSRWPSCLRRSASRRLTPPRALPHPREVKNT